MNNFITWIKGLFAKASTKAFIGMTVDALDLAVPYLAAEIEKIEKTFKDMTPTQKAQWVVDKIQGFLKKQFKLKEPA